MLLAASLCATAPLSAQTIRGSLVDELSAEAIPGAFVVLLDSTGAELTRALTDPFGRYVLHAPAAGTYMLRSIVVGMRSWTSEPLHIGPDQAIEYRIDMPSDPVRLPAVVVEADRNCRLRPGAAVAAGQLWEQARKVLEAVVWTERHGVLRHRVVRFDRRLDPRTLEIRAQDVETRTGLNRGSPFVTESPELLLSAGYVRETDEGNWIYDAPDPHVLLSDQFADLHCFAVDDAERAGLVGLAFEPVQGREPPDIEGILWLDGATAELSHLDFRYTRLPYDLRSNSLGGRVEFVRLAAGPWIVSRWWIRMPEIEIRPRVRGIRGSTVISGIREQGGWVDEVLTPDGEPLYRAPTAVLVGRLVDREERPLAGGRVRLLGIDRVAPTGRSGRFRFDSLTPGRHLVTFAHDDVDATRLVQPPHLVVIGSADTVEITLAVRSPDSLLVTLCSASAATPALGMLAGVVSDDATAAVLPGAEVAVSWKRLIVTASGIEEEREERRAVTDDRGYYHACAVPTRVPLTAKASLAGWSALVATLEVSAARIVRKDFALIRERR